MYKELLKIRSRIDTLIKEYEILGYEREFKKVGEIYGEKGKYALYLAPKETEKELGWDDAMDYCKSLGGELPTIGELKYLYDNCKEEFQYTTYWSSSQDSATASWRMGFLTGNRGQLVKTFSSRVRAVRRVSL